MLRAMRTRRSVCALSCRFASEIPMTLRRILQKDRLLFTADIQYCSNCTAEFFIAHFEQAGDAFRSLTQRTSPYLRFPGSTRFTWFRTPHFHLSRSDDVTLDAYAYLVGATCILERYWRSGGLKMIRLRLVILIPLLQLLLGCLGILGWWNTWLHLFSFAGQVSLAFSISLGYG